MKARRVRVLIHPIHNDRYRCKSTALSNRIAEVLLCYSRFSPLRYDIFKVEFFLKSGIRIDNRPVQGDGDRNGAGGGLGDKDRGMGILLIFPRCKEALNRLIPISVRIDQG